MKRKSSPASNILYFVVSLIFFSFLVINAFGDERLMRLTIWIIVLFLIGSVVLRMVVRLFDSEVMSSGSRNASVVTAVVGVVGFGAAVYFVLAARDGGTSVRELFRWEPLVGAFDTLLQWGGLLLVGGLVTVVASVALIVVLRRASNLPGGSSGWKGNDDPYSR